MRSNGVIRFFYELFDIYMTKRVSRSAAELSYFLTLSVFPTLICLYALIGESVSTQKLIYDTLNGIIPTESLDTIADYLRYVQEHSGRRMLYGGAALMATSSAAAFRAVHNIMSDIYGMPRYHGFGSVVVSFLFSLVFLAVMYFAAGVIVTGEWFLHLLDDFMPVPWDWSWIRFVLLFAILLLAMMGLYRLTSPKGKRGALLPGACLAAVLTVAVGMGFSAMMSASVRYSMVYGSMASVIILMLWLYFFCSILIMGNAVNYLLQKYRGEIR